MTIIPGRDTEEGERHVMQHQDTLAASELSVAYGRRVILEHITLQYGENSGSCLGLNGAGRVPVTRHPGTCDPERATMAASGSGKSPAFRSCHSAAISTGPAHHGVRICPPWRGRHPPAARSVRPGWAAPARVGSQMAGQSYRPSRGPAQWALAAPWSASPPPASMSP
jgi:hypothetical protein